MVLSRQAILRHGEASKAGDIPAIASRSRLPLYHPGLPGLIYIAYELRTVANQAVGLVLVVLGIIPELRRVLSPIVGSFQAALIPFLHFPGDLQGPIYVSVDPAGSDIDTAVGPSAISRRSHSLLRSYPGIAGLRPAPPSAELLLVVPVQIVLSHAALHHTSDTEWGWFRTHWSHRRARKI